MGTSVNFKADLSSTFTTLLLLTGSAERSEIAMVAGIQNVELCHEPAAELLLLSISAAVHDSAWKLAPPIRELQAALAMLPDGLHSILRLPVNLRVCFVLRMLVSLPAAVCAQLLHLDGHEFDDLLFLAAQALAEIEQQRESQSILFEFPQEELCSA